VGANIRYASVDALRGITVAAMLVANNPGSWSHVFPPLLHAQWHGCTLTDLVFPFFLVIVGVSIALGVVPRVEQGGDRAALSRTVLVRALRILGLGLLLHFLAWWWLDLPHYRPWGVLQRIGICFALAGMAAIWLRPLAQWLLLGGVLTGYALLLAAGGVRSSRCSTSPAGSTARCWGRCCTSTTWPPVRDTIRKGCCPRWARWPRR